MLQRLIDRLTVTRALARCPAQRDDDGLAVQRSRPVFTRAGSRVGGPRILGFDWSRLPEPHLSSRGARKVLDRALDALPARYRAAVLIDTEGMTPAAVAACLGEPIPAVWRRLHRVRMALRERLTDHFVKRSANRSHH